MWHRWIWKLKIALLNLVNQKNLVIVEIISRPLNKRPDFEGYHILKMRRVKLLGCQQSELGNQNNWFQIINTLSSRLENFWNKSLALSKILQMRSVPVWKWGNKRPPGLKWLSEKIPIFENQYFGNWKNSSFYW